MALIGMMHQPRLRTAKLDRFAQRVHCQYGLEGRPQFPAHYAPGIRVHHDRQVDERTAHAHVADVGLPELIETVDLQVFGPVWVDRAVLIRVRRQYVAALAYRQQIVVAHQPQDLLVVHRKALPTQFGGHSTIAVAAICERNALHTVTHFQVGFDRLVSL